MARRVCPIQSEFATVSHEPCTKTVYRERQKAFCEKIPWADDQYHGVWDYWFGRQENNNEVRPYGTVNSDKVRDGI